MTASAVGLPAATPQAVSTRRVSGGLLDPKQLWKSTPDALRKLNQEEGLTIVLVEQNTERALNVAQQVCVLASGRSVFTGSAENARRDVDLLHSYASAAA